VSGRDTTESTPSRSLLLS